MTLYELIVQGFWIIEHGSQTLDSYLSDVCFHMGVSPEHCQIIRTVLEDGKK